jgi:hypothetical protein
MRRFIVGVIVGLCVSGAFARRVPREIEGALMQSEERALRCEAEKSALMEYAAKCLIECKEPFPFKPA